MRERVTRDGGVRQSRAIEARALVADHDFQAVVVHAIGDLDQSIRLMEVAPLDGVLGHLHDGLPKLHDLVVAQRSRLADEHREVVQVLEEVDLAVDLDVDLAVQGPVGDALSPGAGRRDRLEESIHAVGLGDIGVGADAKPVDSVLDVVQGREHDDRNQHGRAVASQAAGRRRSR